MKKNSHFLASEIPQTGFDRAAFHIIPAPLEKTVSYGGGTAKAPVAIIEASSQLELWNGSTSPGLAGIHTCRPVCSRTVETCLKKLETITAASLAVGAVPVTLGGEHTVTLGAARAVHAKYGQNAGIVQIDAHADLRDRFEGTPYSHACVMRRVHEATGWPLLQIGIRAYCREEADYREAHENITCLTGEDLDRGSIRTISLPDYFPEHVYLTIDIDGFDPSVFPATGTPVPGGPGWYQGLDIIRSIAVQRNIVAFDLVEHAPSKYVRHCDFAAAQLVYTVMGFILSARNGGAGPLQQR
ncbi:MAG: agmatinase [Spirochaetales bacterium]|nr:agmatinase [Spirochaetales bacterium]